MNLWWKLPALFKRKDVKSFYEKYIIGMWIWRPCLVFLLVVIFIDILWAKSVSKRGRMRRNAYRNESRLWPKAVVAYTIDDAYKNGERSIIKNAMWDIQSVSCIKFKERKNENAYVEINRGKGCRSVVGYIGRPQKLTLGYGCISIKMVLHELFHVLGFFHEHSRPDRDEFVNILTQNVKKASVGNFKKMSESVVTTFGLPYDYRSILHYHDREFTVHQSKRTIESKSGREIIGQATGLSKMDILKLNKLYHCPKKKNKSEFEDEGSGQTELEDNFIVVSL